MASANLPAERSNDPVVRLKGQLDRNKGQYATALPKGFDVERFLRVAITEMRRVPNLQKCTIVSLMGSLMQAAQLGLEPDGLLGRAYLVPYGDQATLIVGYKGLVDLARRSGQIVSIEAHAVHEGDEFEYSYGLNPVLRHVPADPESDAPRKLIAAWALARFVGGGHQIDVMRRNEIESIRRKSKAGTSGPWREHYDEMAKKTVLRRAAKLWPLTPQAAIAIAREEMAEAGVYVPPEDDGLVIDVEEAAPAFPAPDSKSARLAARIEPPRKPDDPAAGPELDGEGD